MSFQLYKLATVESYPRFKYVCIWAFLFAALPPLHYLLAKYNLRAALLFTSIQTPIIVVTTLELSIFGNPN